MRESLQAFTFIQCMFNPADTKKVFVIIPAYNETASINTVLEGLIPYGYSIVVVDDGSAESLLPVIREKKVHFLRHKVNLGQGAALQTGIDYALGKNAEYVVTFDADGQHDAADVQLFIDRLEVCKKDIVMGSRFLSGSVHNMTVKRKFLLQVARFINFMFTGLLLSDAHNGLRVMTGLAAARIQIKENRMAHASEFLSQIRKNKLLFTEAPSRIQYTDYSRAKGQTLWSSFRIFFDLLLNKIFR